MTKLFLIRHGENQANLTKEFSHRKVDYPLNAKGRLQAEQTAEALSRQGIEAIYSSPLRRALETASVIGARLDLPVTVFEEFREINVGDLEEQPPTAESWRFHDSILRAWFMGEYGVAFPGGEDYYTLHARAMAGFRTVVTNHPQGNVVVVAHGGIFTATAKALCPTVDLAALLRQENHNCSISIVQFPADAGDRSAQGALHGSLVQWAAWDHLHGEAAAVVSGSPAKDFFAAPLPA